MEKIFGILKSGEGGEISTLEFLQWMMGGGGFPIEPQFNLTFIGRVEVEKAFEIPNLVLS